MDSDTCVDKSILHNSHGYPLSEWKVSHKSLILQVLKWRLSFSPSTPHSFSPSASFFISSFFALPFLNYSQLSMKRAHMYAKICRRYTLWWWWNRRQPTTKEFSAWAQKCFRFQNRGVGKSKEKRHEPLVEFLFVPTALCIHGDGGTAWSMSQFLPWWGERESEKHFIGKTFSLIPSQESFLFEIFFALVTNTSSQFHEWSGWIQRETRLTWWRNKKPKILFLEARKSLFFRGWADRKFVGIFPSLFTFVDFRGR